MAETARPTRRYLRDDRIALDSEKARAREDRILGVTSSGLIALFMVSMLIPAEFSLVVIRLTPYSALLLVFIVPMFLAFLRQLEEKSNRLILLDWLILLHVGASAVGILYNNGPTRAVFVVNNTITILGGYMIGRVLMRRTTDYEQFFRWFFYGLVFWFPFAVFELVAKRMIISEILALFADPLPRAGNDPRLGLNRVQAFMEHAITYGLLCSVGVANSYYLLRDAPVMKRLGRTGFFAFMTFISLSSAPNIAQGMQFMMIAWDRLLGSARLKWVLLVVVGGATALVVQLAAPHGIVGLVIDNLAFDSSTGWGRTEIFEYGSAEVMRHPWFGIGLGDGWIRPWYRKPSVDNFWLMTALRYGLLALLPLVGGILLHLAIIMARGDLDEKMANYRRGYVIAWIGIIFTLATVHIWGAAPIFIMAYLGAGAMFYTGPELEGDPSAYRRRRDLAARGAEARTGRPPPRGAPKPAPAPISTPVPGPVRAPRAGAPAFPARRAPLPSRETDRFP